MPSASEPVKSPHRGAPRGNANAAKGDEPRDTAFSHRLPASIVARYKAAAERAGISVPDYLIKRAPRAPTP